MKLWLDAHLPPALAPWIQEFLGVEAAALRDLGLRDSRDSQIFEAAREEGAVVVTKDQDFVTLLERRGPPPQVIWVTCGNTSNASLRHILGRTLETACDMLARGEALVEISG